MPLSESMFRHTENLPEDKNRLKRSEDTIGYGSSFDSSPDIVAAHNMRAVEDCGHIRRSGGMEAEFRWRRALVVERRKRLGEEALAGDTCENGQIELLKLVEMGQQGIVFVEPLAETEAWVENHSVTRDSRGRGHLDPLAQPGENKRKDIFGGERSLGRPVLWTASCVHQDRAAA